MKSVFVESICWDGSHIGNFSPEVISEQITIRRDLFCRLSAVDSAGTVSDIWVLLTRFRDYFAAIFDECQSLFFLPKRGFHFMKIGKINYTAYQCPVNENGSPVCETPINLVENSEEKYYDIRELRKVILVSEVLTTNRITESHVRIRDSQGQYQLVNYYSGSSCLFKEQEYDYSTLTKKMSRIFENCDYRKEAASIFNPENLPIVEVIAQYRENIRKIVLKYSRNYEWLIQFMVGRIARIIRYGDC